MTGIGDGSYGDEQAMEQIQGGAPMASAPTGPLAGLGRPGGADPLAAVVPLTAPSQQPGTPVTDGAAAGAGAGPAALGVLDPNQADAQSVAKYLPVWTKIANDANTTPGFKAFLRNVIASLQ